MNVEIKLDEKRKEPLILICTNKVTDEINEIITRISGFQSSSILGVLDGEIFLIEPEEIISIYSSGQKVLAQTTKGELIVKNRLYELEERLAGTSFIRISNSEIVNFKKVKSLDLSISGTITLRLTGGNNSYVSRRYISKIKKYLGI